VTNVIGTINLNAARKAWEISNPTKPFLSYIGIEVYGALGEQVIH
jgi:hypothetical protein